jgi:K+-sensing histidine kinase KdpD
VDAGIVRSALTNIIENAVEACRSDRSGRDHEICFDVTQDAQHIYFNVSDNGIGMDAATRANVFTPFSLPRANAAPAWDCSSPIAFSASTAEAFHWNQSRRPAAAFP